MAFTHLHLHTSYSLLDGAIRLQDLFPKILEHKMTSVAMTDHGNMFGAVDFYKNAKKHGVKPIFGCETYVSSTDYKDRTNRRNFHLILLAKNETGYKNLSYLNSMGFLEGFYYHPRIDKKLLKERSEGLIGLSSCLGGEVAQTVMKQGVAQATEVAKEYASLFEPGSYFLEVMPNGLEEQDKVNDAVRTISRDTGIPSVATNDCHYVNRGDYKAHEILMCIQQKRTITDEKRLTHKTDAYYIKTPEEMESSFKDWPEVLENTERINAMCNVELKLGQTMLPTYKVPEGYDLDSYIGKIAAEGLDRRLREKHARGEAFDADQYRERLVYELGVIVKMGFSGYFLIVWDFINWAKEHKIPVGPGRGSGAGSVAAWALRITDIDPITFKLLFERFLNPERVSMPDFDIDFCMDRRDEVIQYVTGKYGKDNVGQIATFHQLKSRGVVRDVARALGMPIAEGDKIAKLVPEPKAGKPPPIDKAIAEEPKLKELYDNNPQVHELLDFCKRLEGLNRHVGMHAAGVVIAEQPLWELVPCFRGDKDEIVTQFAKDEVEAAGLVKFDFLGLKNLTSINIAQKLVNQRRQKEGPDKNDAIFDIDRIPLDDAGVYKMISMGDTTGVFQLESSGMRDMLKKLKPDNIEDIVAAVALYRPGPLQGGMVDDFIDRKHGKKKVSYPHPTLEPILADTYGVIVYQEQVMQIAQVLAGYTLGQADLLRRAMGKKKAEEMAKQKALFAEGAAKLQIDPKIAEDVFDLMAKFAEYGFNRSHSAAYAIVTYQTAYLKHHYPHEYMAALLSCDKDNTDNVVKFIAEARQMGLKVERPDVNESDLDFKVVGDGDDKLIRFGLGAVRGVGEGAVESVLAARAEKGVFSSVYDFAERVDTMRVNRRVLEALVKAGAFDSIGAALSKNRAQQFGALDAALERAAQTQKDKKSGQGSLFSLVPAVAAGAGAPETYADVEEWTPKELLSWEKDSLGFYITGHPLDRYQGDLSRYANANTSELERHADKDVAVSVGGVIQGLRIRPTKDGTGKIAFGNLEDQFGKVEIVVFPRTFVKVEEIIKLDEPLLLTGKIKDEGDSEKRELKMILDEAVPLSRVRAEKTSRIHLVLKADDLNPQLIEELKSILKLHPGGCKTFVHVQIPLRSETVIPLGPEFSVAPTEDLLLRVERLFGKRVALLA